MLQSLIIKQCNQCYYCKVQMTIKDNTKFKPTEPTDATIEHLIDKWSSPKHQKIESEDNIVAACYQCNNTRGSIRNSIARKYYQQIINKYGMKLKAANICSRELYKKFGAVPQEILKL